MTLSDIKTMDTDMLSVAQVAKVIKCDPQYIRITARSDPDALGFPVTVRVGKSCRVQVPRLGFIYWMEHGKAPAG